MTSSPSRRHDRGSYVAFRLAMDHPEAVQHLAVLDSVPIREALARCDATFATRWWHWFFLGNPDARPSVSSMLTRTPATTAMASGRRWEAGMGGLPARHPRSGHIRRHVRGLPRRARH